MTIAGVLRRTVRGEELMMRRVVNVVAALVVVLVGVLLPGLGRRGGTQKATPMADTVPPLPGQVAAAERRYVASHPQQVGLVVLTLKVAEFDTEEHAAAAISIVAEQVPRSPGFVGLQPVRATRVGDASSAFTGWVGSPTSPLAVAALIFQDGRYVHAWSALGLTTDPLPDVLALAGRTTGVEAPTPATPEPGATPAASALLRRLPRLDQLPPGFVLTLDESRLTPGDAATTTATIPVP